MGVMIRNEAAHESNGSTKNIDDLGEIYLLNNKLEHISHIMKFHPQYLKIFLKCQQFLLRGNGPLPYDYRHFIAIMAASRHQCSYLVKIQKNEFLAHNGNPAWLNGLEYVPDKLKDLDEINRILAHMPWTIDISHIEKLAKGVNSWSMSELMQAVVLLAHFHALSSFCFGCGIGLDQENSSRPPSYIDEDDNSNSKNKTTFDQLSEGGIEQLIEKMRKLNEEEPPSVEEIYNRYELIEHSNAELPTIKARKSVEQSAALYTQKLEFTYLDFTKHVPTFRALDYSWDDQGYSLASRLYPEIGTLLDDKFKISYNLTYYTMGDNANIDTTSFRRAIWHYIHCLYGIRHDDYNYGAVNALLIKSLKSYIKTVTCYPERVTYREFNNFMPEFKQSEKVHVNLMLFEARLQAELLYALRVINRYLT